MRVLHVEANFTINLKALVKYSSDLQVEKIRSNT